jgi:3-dehydroquinate synthase
VAGDQNQSVMSPRTAARRVECARAVGYDIRLTTGSVSLIGQQLADAVGERRALIVTTPTVNAVVTQPIVSAASQQLRRQLPVLIVAGGEERKTHDSVEAIADAALLSDLDRTAVLVGIGGGVCLDLVTMAASSIRRGLSHIRVPTTLVGLVDAGVGIKGALNFRGRKSYIGCYCPPELVLLNQAFLATLPDRHFRAGLAEIVKMAIIADAELFALLEREPLFTTEHFALRRGQSDTIVWRSVACLLDELESNLFEDLPGERLADFGHTFSPVIESASAFSVLHGEAVAVDIALSTELAAILGILSCDTRDRIRAVLRHLSLPLSSPFLTLPRCLESLDAARRHRRCKLNLIVPAAIGTGFCLVEGTEISDALLRGALAVLAQDLVVR